MWDVVMWGVVI